MGYQNAYTAYQRTNVNTASQGRLVVLLYEGAVKHLTSALNLFDNNGKIKAKDIEQFGIHIQKAQAIITELQVSLDMEKGGEIARNLMSLYVFFNEELMDASINHTKAKIEFVQKNMNELADSWRTIANSTANAPAGNVANALNIEG
ncbi:flagellar export chaperone FliS [Treponema sp. Marseille-Q3903]|uniref:flagellar export chaperone FliS n=1 Tax=Treponema sp. Marseille-Q3903 TaxID=2766703 RepID=UPI0016525FBC|nr:flagellar export chaperone FliS [Treponema sp. Marseille-Q3903]MBC6713193.1 flagellar export chaperone FliS [Treponema sp. Marseille-Q3903]